MNYIITPKQVNKLTKPVEDFINSQVEKMKNDPEIYDDMENIDVSHALEQIEKVKVKKINFIDEYFLIFLDVYVNEDVHFGLWDILNEIKYKLRKMLPYTILFELNSIETGD
jgi:hypothetical protein